MYNTYSAFFAAMLIIFPSFVVAQNCVSSIPMTKPDSHYSYNTTGDEVTDSTTGLTWRRCVEGMKWSGATCIGVSTSFYFDDALSYAATQGGWRLPNIKELNSLVESSCNKNSINQIAFPATPNEGTCSSSFYASNPLKVWNVNFYDGFVIYSYKGNSFSVRLVRD